MTSESLLTRLEREGRLRRQKADLSYLNDLLDAARRNFEAAFKLFYDGLLQVGRVVVLQAGYRPDDGEQHRTTFQAAGTVLGAEFDDLTRKIQKFRIKRNDCIYEPSGLIGNSDAQAIHRTSRAFWAKVRARLEKENPQLRLFSEF